MTKIKRLMMLHRLMDKAGEHGSDAGGTGTGSAAGTGDGQDGGEGSGTGDGQGEAGGTGGESGQGEASKGGEGKEGANKPTDAEAKLLRDMMKAKDRARALEAELAAAREAARAFDGIDPAKARKILAEQEEAERNAAIARGEFDRLTKQMADRHAAEQQRLKEQLEERERIAQSLQSQIADLTIGNSFSGSKFVAEDLTLTPSKARVIYGSHFEFKDGKVVGYDKPAGASDRTPLVDAMGEPLSFDEAMRKLIDSDPDKDHLIRSKVKAGAGSGTNTKGAAKAPVDSTKGLTSIEKIAAGLKNIAK